MCPIGHPHQAYRMCLRAERGARADEPSDACCHRNISSRTEQLGLLYITEGEGEPSALPTKSLLRTAVLPLRLKPRPIYTSPSKPDHGESVYFIAGGLADYLSSPREVSTESHWAKRPRLRMPRCRPSWLVSLNSRPESPSWSLMDIRGRPALPVFPA